MPPSLGTATRPLRELAWLWNPMHRLLAMYTCGANQDGTSGGESCPTPPRLSCHPLRLCDGCQVEVDKPTGAHWLTRAAEAGHAKACNRLGWCCE